MEINLTKLGALRARSGRGRRSDIMAELGRRTRTPKHRGHPNSYPNEGPARIEKAYEELSHHAFAVWMRLMAATEAELRLGRVKLTRLLGYSESRGNAVLLELRRLGYISWLTSPGRPSRCTVQRRAVISGRNQFVRLSNLLLQGCDESVEEAECGGSCVPLSIVSSCCQSGQFCTKPAENAEGDNVTSAECTVSQSFPRLGPPLFAHQFVPEKKHSVFYLHFRRILTLLSTHSYPSFTILFPMARGPQSPQPVAGFRHFRPSRGFRGKKRKNTVGHTHRDVTFAGGQLAALRSLFASEERPTARHKFVTETEYLRPSSHSLLRERLRERVLIERAHRKDVQGVAKRSLARARAARGKTRVDFATLDHRGDPAVSFDPDSPLRDRMVELLGRASRDPERRKMLAKLGVEFSRIYTRYRRAAEQEFGMKPNSFQYDVLDPEKPYAAEAAMWCVIKGITPRELLEYWHKNIRTFADRGMKIPPLSLLKAPGIVDQAACAKSGTSKAVSKPKEPKRDPDPRPPGRNSFSDTDGLDRRLRRGLERDGFDTRDYNDRFLMTLQQLAKGLANGQKVFISTKLLPMVTWAAKNLYGFS